MHLSWQPGRRAAAAVPKVIPGDEAKSYHRRGLVNARLEGMLTDKGLLHVSGVQYWS